MGEVIQRVAVTGGAGQIAYSLLFRIASGELFGPKQPIFLSILEVPDALGALAGVVMELEDCAFPMLRGVRTGSDPMEVFEGADIAFLVGAKPRGPGMERRDLLAENGKIFIGQGRALAKTAAKECVALVVGNPCNTNCLIAQKHAGRTDRLFAMTRLDQNRAAAMLAIKAKALVSDVSHVTIWGNHSSTQVPDFLNARIHGKPAMEVVHDRKWCEETLTADVQKRGAAVIAARGKSSAASAANAAIDAMKSLLFPTPKGEWFSMGIHAQGNPYGIEEDLVFSFPCRSFGGGKVEIVPNVPWDDFLRQKIRLTEKELLEEKHLIQDLI